jgi:hypothetical protein
MTRFLLAGTPGSGGSGGSGGAGGSSGARGEVGLAAAAHRVVAAAAWYGWLRRWGLLLSFGLARDPVAEVRACLVVLASDDAAAERLAAGWEMVSGYRVAVLALTGEPGAEGTR